MRQEFLGAVSEVMTTMEKAAAIRENIKIRNAEISEARAAGVKVGAINPEKYYYIAPKIIPSAQNEGMVTTPGASNSPDSSVTETKLNMLPILAIGGGILIVFLLMRKGE